MRRQPWLQNSALAVVAFVFFVRNAQAAAPSYDEGYGGGDEGDGKPSEGDGTPCYNDGYGAPCSNDALVAGAALPDDGGIKRTLATATSTISRDDYGSSTDYGSEDGLLPCTCLETWTAYERDVNKNEDEEGACGLNNHGCPQTPCDGDANGPWCKVVHSPCLEEETTHNKRWAYCASQCDTYSWDVFSGSVLGDPSDLTDYITEECSHELQMDKDKQQEECEDLCKLNPLCSGFFMRDGFNMFLKNTHNIDKKKGSTSLSLLDGDFSYHELNRLGKGPCEDKMKDRPDNQGGDDDGDHDMENDIEFGLDTGGHDHGNVNDYDHDHVPYVNLRGAPPDLPPDLELQGNSA